MIEGKKRAPKLLCLDCSLTMAVRIVYIKTRLKTDSLSGWIGIPCPILG